MTIEPTIIVARVLRDTGDCIQVDDGTGQRTWLPKHLVDIGPVGEPQHAVDALTETRFVEVTMQPDLAAVLGVG